MNATYRLHLEPEPEGGFTVTVPALPGCITWGRDYAHALEMAREAIEGHLEALTRHGQTIPGDVPYQALDVLLDVAV
jgi:predicted RNase H-like HicB family nuclease